MMFVRLINLQSGDITYPEDERRGTVVELYHNSEEGWEDWVHVVYEDGHEMSAWEGFIVPIRNRK